MANSYSCSCLFNNVNTNVRFLIMANRDKFLHNINKARRQRKNEQWAKEFDIQADKIRHIENMIAVNKLKIKHKNNRELLEQEFYNCFNPFNTTNLKNNEDV